jgi:hypothetical protein
MHAPLNPSVLKELRGHRLANLMRAWSKIPEDPGVYIWRYWPSLKSLDTGDFATMLQDWQGRQPAFTEFLTASRLTAEITRSPFGVSHTANTMLGIDMGGAKGRRFLEAMETSPEQREVLFNLLETIISAMPPIYIGKADNLRSRLSDHFLGKGSTLLSMIDEKELSHDDVYVSYLIDPISTSDVSITTFLEEIAQRLTNPPLTKRYG